ncbi:hypothetical protein BH24ACT3_BH24ACT3_12690 [soil metagenome]
MGERRDPTPAGYHGPGDFEDEVDRLAASAPNARRDEFGRSVECRPLVAMTIGHPDRSPDPARPQAVVLAGIHGVEVISTELALRLLGEAVAATPDSPPGRLLAKADLTIVACLNPDSRTASLASLGRRRLLNGAPRRNANGVDLNRNWPWPAGVRDHWLPISGTRSRRTPWCRGPHPLSEPETAAFAALVDARRPFALLNLHSTGRILTHPWSSRPEPPADLDGFRRMAEAFRAAQPHTRYRWKQSRAWYPIIGSSNDWFYERHGTLALTVETSEEARTPRDDPRTARWFFWYANPVDVQHHLDNDAPGCWAALLAALDHRTSPTAARPGRR